MPPRWAVQHRFPAAGHLIFRHRGCGTPSASQHVRLVRAFPPPIGRPNQWRFDGAIASNYMRARPMAAGASPDKGVQRSIVGIRRSHFWRPLFFVFGF
jgi:hypothetical protein